MIVPRNIRENRINFYIGTTALAEEGRTGGRRLQFSHIWEKIDNMEDVLTRLPNAHRELLAKVPIIIWNGPESVRRGWYPLDHRSSRWLVPVSGQQICDGTVESPCEGPSSRTGRYVNGAKRIGID